MPLDTETMAQLRETVRRFVRERLIPNERKVEESDAIPADILAEMRELGLFGLTIPEEFGGLGLNTEEEVQIVYEVAHASPAYRSCFASTIGIGSQGIVIDGTPEQRRKYLPRMAKGELIGSFALTEPDIGSDAAHLQLSARRDGGDFVLNGTKRFITNAPEAGLFTVMARSDPKRRGRQGHHRLPGGGGHARPAARQDRPQARAPRLAYLRRDLRGRARAARQTLSGPRKAMALPPP